MSQQKQDDNQTMQATKDTILSVTPEARQEVFYFAYGSNLSTEQMRQRCPFSVAVGVGHLKGWRWIINERGYANIVQVPRDEDDETRHRNVRRPHFSEREPARRGPRGKQQAEEGVYGLIYLLTPQDEVRLDGYEGVPHAYQKVQMDIKMVRNSLDDSIDDTVRALVYVDVDRIEEDVPHDDYIRRLERGIRDAVMNWGFDEHYADHVMRRFWRRPRHSKL